MSSHELWSCHQSIGNYSANFKKNLHLLRSLSLEKLLFGLAIKYTLKLLLWLHEQVTDVGLVQLGPFYPQSRSLTLDKSGQIHLNPRCPGDGLLAKVANFKPNFILCDISLLGIKVGGILGCPLF